MEKACVFGAGAWGTALAQYLTTIGKQVKLVVREAERDLVNIINKKLENTDYLPDIPLSENIRATCDPEEGVADARIIMFVVPTPFLRSFSRNIHRLLPKGVPIVNCSKGIENESLQTGVEILKEELPGKYHNFLAVLSGPNFAREISKGLPANTTIAAENADNASLVQDILSSKLFRCYTSDDVIGVETGGALKNVIAIAGGAADGLGLGESARAGLITRGLAEMTRLAVRRGGNPLTLSGLSGVGDLVLTCSSSLSRNRTLGFELGQGRSFKEMMSSRKTVAEGYKTSKSVYQCTKLYDVDMSISTEVYRVLYEDKPLADALNTLLTRPIKPEITT